MIVLCVTSYNGAPTEARETSFDELGGTIGRATTNQLVLPDTDRSISRVHAQVVMRNGGFAVIDRGSNAIIVNGTPLGNGRESAIQPGDRLNIGGYVIEVRAGHRTVAKDPFEDLFGSAAPARAAAAPAAFASNFAPSPPAATVFAGPPAGAPSAFPSAAPGAIPDDWDPFAPDAHNSGVRLMPGGPSAADPLGLGLGGPAAAAARPLSAGQSVDDLFGLGAAGGSVDPFSGLGSLGAGTPPANTAADADPLRALMQPARAAPPAAHDNASDLQMPWHQPAAPLPPPRPPVATPAPALAAPVAPNGAILSWDASMQDNKVITLPDVRHLPPPEAAPPPKAPMPPAGDPASRPGDESAALLAALLQGLGLAQSPFERLTPAHMQLIGSLLRESTRGAVELLRARAALKRELRAQVTMIVTRENNPLKFSPTVDMALGHLLGPTTTGFMAPAPAMRDAFDDLRAHEFGMMAGMRAALEGVLARFDPQALDGALSKRGGLAALLPGSRKAQLWERFEQLYGQLSHEAADDFHALFGKAFLKAYEAQLIALEGEAGAPPQA